MARDKAIVSTDQIKALLEQDGDFLRPIAQNVMQEVLEVEMTEQLGAERYERTDGRVAYRSGYYRWQLVTRVGRVELRVPQDRQGHFSTEPFDRYQRSEKALVMALVESYVRGVSTRKVKAITEQLCGQQFSASSVSRLVKRLDRDLRAFASRALTEEFPYVILDARYERVREDWIESHRYLDMALLREERKLRLDTALLPEATPGTEAHVECGGGGRAVSRYTRRSDELDPFSRRTELARRRQKTRNTGKPKCRTCGTQLSEIDLPLLPHCR